MNNETSNLPSSQELNNNRVDNSNIPVVKISNPDADEIYMLRSIPVEFGGDYNPKLIITQNNNGPCPLLALCTFKFTRQRPNFAKRH